MRTFLGYTLSLERPPLHGFNYASTTQLCHESTAFPSVFLCPYFATLNTVGEKSGLEHRLCAAPVHLVRFIGMALTAELRGLVRHWIGVVRIVGRAQEEHGCICAR